MSRRFSVWAPQAQSVEIVVDGVKTVMGSSGGRWIADMRADSLEPRYAFFVDGEGPFPDPRAPRLPDGVHGPAQVVDHSRFSWSDKDFRAPPLSSAVFYELHVGTFAPIDDHEYTAGFGWSGPKAHTVPTGGAPGGGTFDSAAGRLGELAELGVTHVELMPVASSSGNRGWGYDGVGLYAPFEAYGGPEGLKRFVDRAHAHGLAVCLDCVYNHLGPEGNYLGKFGPYFTDAYNTPWGDAVNFDHEGADEVRAFVLDNIEQWFRDYHIDAIRLDAVHALYDESAVHIMEAMAERTHRLEGELGKPLELIAESNMNNPSLVTPREAGGTGLSAHWSDDFHHVVHTLLTGEEQGYYAGFRSLGALAKSLRDVYVHDGGYSPARGRHVGRPVGALPRSRFVHCSQNHDQVGNRAVGERICHLVSPERAKIAAALTILQPAVPMLFMGEEWAASSPFQFFTDHRDPGLGEAVTKGRCSEFVYFGWNPEDVPDPQAPETFERSMLNWQERETGAHREMLEWYRSLLSLRRRAPELSASTCEIPEIGFRPDGDNDARGLLWFRRGRYLVALHLAAVPSDDAPSEAAPSADASSPDPPSHDAPQDSQNRSLHLHAARASAESNYCTVNGHGNSFPASAAPQASGVKLLLSCGGASLSESEEQLLLGSDSLAVVDLLAEIDHEA